MGEEDDGTGRERDTPERTQLERDAELLLGIRRNELGALRQFVQRFEPILLDQARRLGVGLSERRTVVTGFLDDILVKLARTPVRSSLASFVITSFRNSVADTHRETMARERCLLAEDVGTEGVVRAGCSEFMLRAAEGLGVADAASSTLPGVALVRLLFDGCSIQERQLLIWTAHRVPLRECAAWLGISYDSAKQRLSRLRARLIRESVTHLAELPDSDRAELTSRLGRVGVKTDRNIDVNTNHEPTRGFAG